MGNGVVGGPTNVASVLALALLEALNLPLERCPSLSMLLGESVKDAILPMALPTLVMAVVRIRQNLFRPATRRR